MTKLEKILKKEMSNLTEKEFDYLMENANWIQLYEFFYYEYQQVRPQIKEVILNLNELLEKVEKDC